MIASLCSVSICRRTADQCFPAFINLQQYYVEEYLVDVLDQTPLTELRWQSKVSGVRQTSDSVEVTVQTPAGPYTVTADYLLAADGSRSTIRGLLGLEFVGEVFQDHFLIADVRMRAERPAERWFWFDPPFARGQSALLHKQPDDIWRLDFQLGWNIDREAELDPERIGARVRRMLGADVAFELEWASIYTFQCRRLARFVHDRVIFAGDAAHLVSPFGARGANGGVQDIDNLCWKLALVLAGTAPQSLLASYDAERGLAADENIRHSTRSTEFITPKIDDEPCLSRGGPRARARSPFCAGVRQQRAAVAAVGVARLAIAREHRRIDGWLAVDTGSAGRQCAGRGGRSSRLAAASPRRPVQPGAVRADWRRCGVHVEPARTGDRLARRTARGHTIGRAPTGRRRRQARLGVRSETGGLAAVPSRPASGGARARLRARGSARQHRPLSRPRSRRMTRSRHDEPTKLTDPDGFYQALLDLHEGLDVEHSLRLDARLILLMAERIGDDAVLRELLALAAAARE